MSTLLHNEFNMHGFIHNIEELTLGNQGFRKVLYTAEHLQLVLMSLKPSEEIGEEVHEKNDQFFRVEQGNGEATINGEITKIESGDVVIIPVGARHNIKNTSTIEPLKLYSLYSPPHHKDGIVHATKEDAEKSKEEFDGKTTEQ